jgi:hypothetical protein
VADLKVVGRPAGITVVRSAQSPATFSFPTACLVEQGTLFALHHIHSNLKPSRMSHRLILHSQLYGGGRRHIA